MQKIILGVLALLSIKMFLNLLSTKTPELQNDGTATNTFEEDKPNFRANFEEFKQPENVLAVENGNQYSSKYTYEDGVILGADSNMQSILAEFDFVFIDFYTHWCKYCKLLAPEFAQTAQTLAETDPDVKLIKINLGKHYMTRLAFGVHKFPTLLLWVRETQELLPFTYVRSAEVMTSWVKRKKKAALKKQKAVGEGSSVKDN